MSNESVSDDVISKEELGDWKVDWKEIAWWNEFIKDKTDQERQKISQEIADKVKSLAIDENDKWMINYAEADATQEVMKKYKEMSSSVGSLDEWISRREFVSVGGKNDEVEWTDQEIWWVDQKIGWVTQEVVPEWIKDDIDVDKLESIIADIKKTWEVDKRMNLYIESSAKNWLLSIKSQCLKIIESFKWEEINKEVTAKAILSLLKINQVLWIVKIEWWDPINLKGNCFEQLVNLIWTKEFNFVKILWPDEWKIVAAACEEWKKLLQKPSEEEQQKINNWNQSKDEISYLKEVSDWLTWEWVSWAFIELRNKLNEKWNEEERKKFEKAVFTLIQKCCPEINWICTDENDVWYTKLEKNFYSDKIKEFQQAVFDKSKEEGADEEYKKAWEDLSQGIEPAEKAIDGKLWRNTLNCLVRFATKWLEFKPKEFEEKDGTARLNVWTVKKETWASIERMPLTFTSFMQFWTLSEEWGFKVFKFKDNPWESDFVMKELWTDKKYVEISGKKFYIEWDELQWEPQFRNIPVVHKWRDSDWNIIPIKTTELCFWTFDESWKLVNWSKVIIDSEWKQISSLIITEIKDKDWNIVNLWVKTMWWKEKTITQDGKPVDKQVVKRRIDVFGKGWNDTKEMSDEQINTILANPEACKVVLDLAINAYKEMMHRPSHVWRYNLNHIIDGLLLKFSKDADISDKLLKLDWKGYRWYFDEWLSADDRVCRFLWLSEWLRSNPENKINKTDLSVAQMNEFDARGKASERKEYRSGLKQYERIVGRLWLLKDILDKKDLNPKTWLWEK